ncbi:glycosyltransferase [Paenibacillus lautus]|uniref:glycosyltransferase n=1 Tax=Paenibacillus lautus TaxID=1401 RepID=UPI003D284172
MDFTGERFIPELTDKELEIEHLQRYQSLSEIVRDKVVLDAACGEGYGAYLLSKSASFVHGIDIDPDTVTNAKQKYHSSSIEFHESSIEILPFEDNFFDVIVSFETLEHVNEVVQLKFMKEIRRVLKDEGILIISTPNKKYYSDDTQYANPYHVKELYRDEFEKILNGFFDNFEIISQRFEVVSLMDSFGSGSSGYQNLNNDSSQVEKYMIAICSNAEISASSICSVKTFKGKFISMTGRIVDLQKEVEERNNHITTLDKELDFLRSEYQHLEMLKDEMKSSNLELMKLKQSLLDEQKDHANVLHTVDKLKMEITILQKEKEHLEKHNNDLTEKINLQSFQKEESTQRILNLEGHVQLLLEAERKLNNIYNSSGWRLLLKYYKARDKVIPENSKRRIISKLIAKTIKNPKSMLNKINKTNIKKLKYYLKSENAKQLENRIDNYIERHTESPNVTSIQLYDKNEYQHIEFEHFENPKVSIVIPVYNQWHYTYSCLASIKANTNEQAYEIIIADDMSTDETVNISQYISNIKVVRDGMNRGFLLNCNNAAQHAKGEYIFFLNNDTNVQPNWLSSLVDLIESNTSIGMAGSKLVYPDGRQQEAGGIIWNDASGWNYGRLDDPEKAEYNYVKEVDYISGAAILVRHDLWRELGGFDERYVPAYFEDTDLAFEIRKLGYKVVLQPESVIVHFEGISHGTDTKSGIKKYQVENKEKFFEKWKDVLTKENFSNGENVFLARDRSRDKKTVVIVDHYVPHFDKDAGGRCTYFYTKLMVSMGYHVIFIGDNFFRHEPYTTALQQLGVEVLYGNDYAKNINQWIRLNGHYVDYVYLNRPHISIKYMDTFKKHTNAKIIYFGHDLHYLREMRNYELTQNASLLKSAEEWREIEFELFGLADVIHVVGTYEQQVLKEQLPNKLIRNIPLYPYETIYGDHHSIPSFDERQDLLFVGGFNHKPNYDGILWFINEILPTIKATHPNMKLYIVGSNPPDDIKEKSSKNIIVTGYVTDEELERYYNSCRIVVVPLRFGAGVKGKVVEAIHYQVPVVTTTIGAEGLAETEDVLIVCDEASEFADKVINLYSNQTEWQSRSTTSGDYVRKFFTVKAAQEILALDMGD